MFKLLSEHLPPDIVVHVMSWGWDKKVKPVKIVYCDNLDGNFGLYYHDYKKIKIWIELSDVDSILVLVHELRHFWQDTQKFFDFDQKKGYWSKDVEIDAFSEQFKVYEKFYNLEGAMAFDYKHLIRIGTIVPV